MILICFNACNATEYSIRLTVELRCEGEEQSEGKMIIFVKNILNLSILSQLYLCEFWELDLPVELFGKVRVSSFSLY